MFSLELFFVIALLLYSLSIWSHKMTGKMHFWMLCIFGAGLAADILGTTLLCVINTARWQFTTHTISGFAALIIMALHFVWALRAVKIGGKFESYFNRYSVSAWFLWLFAFVSGIPSIGK
ncbi:MAG: hypothetical protein UX07_C0025G0011 [Parcubacteria group bacterium GW2011_GWA2_45_30]|nr:MAG: hypothetical protein UX07_C0025G0011 [Parcubacteria group bacterium GW2011_GWA2_45_30]